MIKPLSVGDLFITTCNTPLFPLGYDDTDSYRQGKLIRYVRCGTCGLVLFEEEDAEETEFANVFINGATGEVHKMAIEKL